MATLRRSSLASVLAGSFRQNFRTLFRQFIPRPGRPCPTFDMRLEALEARWLLSNFTEYPVPTLGGGPLAITSGPDGALWFTENNASKIGRLTTDGKFTEYSTPTWSTLEGITSGSDGAIWFTETQAHQIGRLDPATGTFTELSNLGGNNSPYAITSGPDGALYVVEYNNGRIGRLDPATYSWTRFKPPTRGTNPTSITTGPDGALWFTEDRAGQIGRLDPRTGFITEFFVGFNHIPTTITSGPDNALWFTDPGTNQIGRIDLGGQVTMFAVPTASSEPQGIVTGPDGALWFTENGGNNLGRITTAGQVQEFAIPTLGSGPVAITTGSDNALWLTENAANQIGKFFEPSLSPIRASFSATAGVAFTGVLGSFSNADTTDTSTDYSATITWGDGQTSTGTITANGKGGFDVSGGHTYARGGSYGVTILVNDMGGASVTVNSTATVIDKPLTATGTTFYGVEYSTFSGLVATFTDAQPATTARDYSAIINWGDGWFSTGTISANASGGFNVTGTHTYAEDLTWAVTVTIRDMGGTVATANSTAIISRDTAAYGAAINATVGQAFSGVVGTYVDPYASALTARIAWGDGQTSVGTIIATGNLTYNVLGTHTYTTSGSFTTTILVFDPWILSESANGSATVAPAALTANGNDVTGTEGVGFTSPVATFTDADAQASPGNFKATITWGDGQTSTGTILANGNGNFTVMGTHTYAEEDTYPISVLVLAPGGSTASTRATASVGDAPLTAMGTMATPNSGTPFTGVVTTFSDPGTDGTIADYAATIAWGDGQTSAGTITANGNQTFSVSGTNTYALVGSYAIAVSIADQGGSQVIAGGTANVGGSTPTVSASPVTATEAGTFTGTVATFQDALGGSSASRFSAIIAWGDGQTSTGTITANGNGNFTVTGTYAYTEEDTYATTVTIIDTSNYRRGTAGGTAIVTDAPLTAAGGSIAPTKGVAFNGVVATFTDPGSDGTVTEYFTTITWGDGHTSSGTLSRLGADQFQVSGTNTYGAEGSYTINVTIQDAGGAIATATTHAGISDQPLAPTGTTIQATEGTAFNGLIATFTDADLTSAVSDYTTTIFWGDGQTSTGTLTTDPNGGFDIYGSNTYARFGSYGVTVTIQDQGGAQATVQSSAAVADAGLSVTANSVSTTEGVSFAGVVASFTDDGPAGTISDYTAAITWGDGQTSTGTVIANASGRFDVSGSHNYHQAGPYALTFTILDQGGASASAQSSASVADASLGGTGATIAATEGTTFSRRVATFTDANPFGSAADFTATITWGDGQTSPGTVKANGQGKFDVTGGNTYQEDGSYTITVSIQDPEGAGATITSTASVADASLTATGTTVQATKQSVFDGVVATFTDANSFGSAGDFSATITWGDGQTSLGTLTSNPQGAFDVTGRHTYAQSGAFAATVTILDSGGAGAAVQDNAVVASLPLPGAAAGILVTPTSGLVTTASGGTAAFAVVLASQPAADVTILVTSSNPNEGAVSQSRLTFTPADWNVAQAVTVTGADSGGTTGNVTFRILLTAAASTDTAYTGLKPSDVFVTNQHDLAVRDTGESLPPSNHPKSSPSTVTQVPPLPAPVPSLPQKVATPSEPDAGIQIVIKPGLPPAAGNQITAFRFSSFSEPGLSRPAPGSAGIPVAMGKSAVFQDDPQPGPVAQPSPPESLPGPVRRIELPSVRDLQPAPRAPAPHFQTQVLWQALDQFEEDTQPSRVPRLVTAGVVTSIVATAGYVLLSSRLTLWLLSAMTARPLMWRRFDPVDILFAWEAEKDRLREEGAGAEEKETLQSLVT